MLPEKSRRMAEKLKIGLASDLHLDFGAIRPEFFEWRGDVLLLAGDVGEEDRIRKPSYRATFWDKVVQMAPTIYYIVGNHEYYNSEWDTAEDHLLEFLEDYPSITLLHNEAVDLTDDVVLWAGTMWTNLADNPVAEYEAAMRMNDYRMIRIAGAQYRPLTTAMTSRENKVALAELQQALKDQPDKEFFVMTHHCPTFYGGWKGSLDPAYANDLKLDAYPQVKNWVHGHMHDKKDYEYVQCHVRSNPMGYPGEPTHDNYEVLTIEL
jgi:predicted MPP superfamily phosphohydrolase